MPDKGFKTITVPVVLHGRINKKAKQENKSITTYATEILASYMEVDEKLSRYAPLLEPFGFEGNVAILWDHKKGRSVDVYLYDNKLQCGEDKSEDCIHVAFCQALPQVRRVTRG